MPKKIIAVVYSDQHLHDWKTHSIGHNRLNQTGDILKQISDDARTKKVPVLFTGDKYDNPKNLDNYLLGESLNWYNDYFKGIQTYEISGNHDMCEKNSFTYRAPSYIKMYNIFPNFHNMDFNSEETPNFMVHGIPYLNNNLGLGDALKERRQFLHKSKPNILLLHTDLPGAKDTDGRIVDSSEEIPLLMNKFFRGFHIVLSGHIHKHQQLASNVWMIGATYQQRSSDKGNQMGYCYLYDDMSLKFIPIHSMPQFIEIEEGTPKPDNFNFYIEIPKKEKGEEKITKVEFSNKAGKGLLAKKYLKAKGIKSKSKRLALIRTFKSLEK
jgi:DNA repair exonuclease SbcCD nuclease subunit